MLVVRKMLDCGKGGGAVAEATTWRGGEKAGFAPDSVSGRSRG